MTEQEIFDVAAALARKAAFDIGRRVKVTVEIVDEEPIWAWCEPVISATEEGDGAAR